MAEKTLKFQWAMDQSSLQAIKRGMDELTAKALALSKALQGTGLPGGGAGGIGGAPNAGPGGAPGTSAGGRGPVASPLTQMVNANAAAFKNMAAAGTSSMQGLTNALKTTVGQQVTQIAGLQAALQKLNATYNSLGGQGATAGLVQQKMVHVAGMLNAAQTAAAPMQQMYAAMRPPLLPGIPMPGGAGAPPPPPGAPPGTPPPPPGGGGRGWLSPIGSGNFSLANPMGSLQTMLGSTAGGAVLARSLGMVGAGAMGLMQQSQGWNNGMLDLKAARGVMMAPTMGRMMGGDISDILKMQELATYDSPDRVEALRRSGSFEARTLAGIGGYASMARGAVGAGGSVTGATDVALDTAEMGRLLEMRDKMGETKDYKMGAGRGYAYFNEQRGSMLSASRLMGRGINFKDGKKTDSYSDWAAGLHARGFSPDEAISAGVQARQMGGSQFEAAFGDTIMSANAAGWSQAGGTLLNAARGGGLGDAARLTRGALGGGIAKAAGFQLGDSLFGFDPRGTISGEGALKAIQQGFSFTGGPEDFNTVQRAQLGIQSADRLAGGFDGYQKGMNLASAISLMPGGTTYAQDALGGKMGFKELAEVASGKTSLRSRGYGITQEQAMGQIGGQAHGLFARFVEQGGDDNISKAMRKMRESGMSEQEYMASLGAKGGAASRRELEYLGVAASDLMGGDVEGGVGMIQALSGVRGLDKAQLKEGKIPGAGISDVEKAAREAEAKLMRESAAALKDNIDRVVKGFEGLSATLASTANFTGLASSAKDATDRLLELAGVPRSDFEKSRGSTTKTALENSVLGNTDSTGVKGGPNFAGPMPDWFGSRP